MSKPVNLTGDYGYDLVHEECDPSRTDSRRNSGRDPAGELPAKRASELEGDYTYDEAHAL